jgi:acyl carrier protein
MTRESVLRHVIDVVESLLRERGAESIVVVEQTSLVDELGFDSLDFVDLTLEIERALGREGFPVQEWLDDQTAASGARFTIAALVEACVAFVEN